MVKIAYYFIVIVVTTITTTSCRELVTDEFADPELTPVLNAILVPGDTIEVQVSYTANINSSTIEIIDNAEISLFTDGAFTELLTYKGEGLYVSSIVSEENKMYACEAIVPGFDAITCSDTIPPAPIVYSVAHIKEATINEEGIALPAVKITFKNDTSIAQYFEVTIRLFHSDYETTGTLENITDPIIVNEGLPLALFSNSLINDTVYQLTLNYSTGGASSSNGGNWHASLRPLIVEFRSVSYTYYQYARSVYLYENSCYPDGLNATTTAFNTSSNIEGGYGIFTGFSVFQSDTIYPNSN